MTISFHVFNFSSYKPWTHPQSSTPTHTQPKKKFTPTHIQQKAGHTHPHPAEKRLRIPKPSQKGSQTTTRTHIQLKKVTPNHIQPKKGYKHPHPLTPSRKLVIPSQKKLKERISRV